LASEKILGDAYRAADQLVVDATTDADAKLRQARFSAEARAPRDATYSAAGDARKFAGPLGELRRAAAPRGRLTRRRHAPRDRRDPSGNLEEIVEHGGRADGIVQSMLMHSRRGSGERRKVALK